MEFLYEKNPTMDLKQLLIKVEKAQDISSLTPLKKLGKKFKKTTQISRF